MRDIAFVVLLPVQNEKRMVFVELSYGLYLKKNPKRKDMDLSFLLHIHSLILVRGMLCRY